jgi:hypothetical protein
MNVFCRENLKFHELENAFLPYALFATKWSVCENYFPYKRISIIFGSVGFCRQADFKLVLSWWIG